MIEEALFALGQIGLRNGAACPTLADSLARLAGIVGGRPTGVAVQLAVALSKVGGQPARLALLRLLGDPRAIVRAEAALALGRFADSLPASEVVPLLEDPSPEVREKVCHALAMLPSDLGAAPLARVLRDTTTSVRRAACRALGFTGSALAADSLAALLERGEQEPSVQVAAVVALGRLGVGATAPTLMKCVHSQWPHVRAASAFALGAVDQWASLEFLARDRAPLVRECAAEALRSTGRPQSEDLLRELAGDSIPCVRSRAVGILERIAVVPDDYKRALSDEAASVRVAAAEALGRRGDPKALPALLGAIHDTDEVAASAAIRAVGRIAKDHPELRVLSSQGAELPVWAMLTSLYSPAAAAQVRLTLAEALIELPDVPAVRLLPLVRDADLRVRARVYEAIRAHRARLREQGHELPDSAWIHANRRPLRDAAPYPDLEMLPRRAIVVTSRGEYVIRLEAREAPRTVAAFLLLARAGFDDGLSFLQVRPDSIVVGEWPRGDGWGGTKHRLRCEVNPLRCERGALGMVVDGKDTGRRQFCVFLSTQPALDGRVTVFGRVVGGMDVLDRLQPGDQILRIETG